MTSNTIPIDLDRAKLDLLLQKLEQKLLTRDDAVELKPLLEKELKRALNKGDTSLAIKISTLLMALNGYIQHTVEL